MKNKAHIFEALGVLIILFQVAVWITSNKPDQTSLINTFWFILKITVPIVIGFILLGRGIDLENNKNNNKNN